MIAVILGLYFMVWLVSSRLLFRHWWKHDSLQGQRRCPNDDHYSYYRDRGYDHKGKCCLGTTKTSEKYSLSEHVVAAMLASLAWPLFLPVAVVVWDRPMPVSEMQARIKELEEITR